MAMKRFKKKILGLLTVFFVFCFLLQNTLPAQQEVPAAAGGQSQPVMRSVFWNTVWGSAWGAVMGISYHLLSGMKFRESVITATTIGGVMGYGLGIYMVLNGLTFDERYLLDLPKPQFGPIPNAFLQEEDPRLLHTRRLDETPQSFGWEATILQFRF